MTLDRDSGSFRDPAGFVVQLNDRIFRVVQAEAIEDLEYLKASGVYAEFVARNLLLTADTAVEPSIPPPLGGLVLEHPRIPFVSYPYEWPFALLKRAALLHLDLHLRALDDGMTLADASAYNVQFRGTRPVFIDVLSLRRYQEGAFWIGRQQFMEQFLNPLLLDSLLGIPFQPWYRGRLEGIATADLALLLRWRHKASWHNLLDIVLPARLQGSTRARTSAPPARAMPLFALKSELRRIRGRIARLERRGRRPTQWQNYEREHSYASPEERTKLAFVADFVAAVPSAVVLDIGCNAGAYAQQALSAGADIVVGIDSDPGALAAAVDRADAGNLNFLPLCIDAANPSPDQGWRQKERRGLASRVAADIVLALAVEHHLAIGRNIPLPDLVRWLVGCAPRGVIEFVPKSDPKVADLLRFREDIFRSYSETSFAQELGRHARIVRSQVISETGRILYAYDRT